MNVEKAWTEDTEALVKMRLSYLIEDNGSLTGLYIMDYNHLDNFTDIISGE